MSPVATNYVEIKVRALDTAKPDLDELKASLDELGAKVDTAKVDVDDEDASVKLLRMNARLAELNRKVANPKIRVDGAARAEAEIAALDLELDRLKEKSDSAGPTGLLGKLLNGAGDQFFANGPPSGGILGTLFGPMGLAIVPAVGAALVELTGLVSGFTAAAAGAGSFALLAEPAIKKVETAYTNLNTAQTAYQTAQAKYAADPTKTNATAATSALDNLKAQQKLLSEMSPSEQGAIKGVQGLVSEFGKLSRAFEPEAFKVFASGLQLVDRLLPDIVPFAKTFADVVSQLLGQAGKFSSSKGFADFLKQFHGIEGPALTAIGDGIGKVVIAFGKLITTMSGKDVAQTIGIAFNIVAGILDGVAGVVKRIMTNWDQMSATAKRDTHEVAVSFDALRSDIAAWAHDLASYFAEASANVARWAQDVQRDADDVVRWFQAIPGEIRSALGSLGSMLFSIGKGAIEGLLHGMESMVGGLLSTAASWGHDIANAIGSPFGIHFSEPSEATKMVQAGQNVALGLAAGMLSGKSSVASAARQIGVAAGALPGGAGAGAAGGGNGTLTVQLQLTGGDSQFMTALAGMIRVKGGDPAILTKKVQFK